MEELNTNGFILLKNAINENSNNFINNSYNINENKLDYSAVKHYIDKTFMPTLKQQLGLKDNIQYHKFRFSNNNNSADASTFHNDLYNFSDLELMPVYTCLTYFDDAVLEVLPGSHLKSNRIMNKLLCNYNKKVEIYVPKNSVVILNSAVFHRGKGYSNTENRRLLQVFECFFSNEHYNEHVNKVIAVQTNQREIVNYISSFSKYFSVNDFVLNKYVFEHYALTYLNLQYKFVLIDIPPYEKQDKFIVYEPTKRVNYEDIKEPMGTNVNVICDKNIKTRDPSNFYLYLLIFIIALIILLVNYKYIKLNKIKKFFKNPFAKLFK